MSYDTIKSYDVELYEAMEKELGTEILFDDKAQLMGALGAAISAYEKTER